MNNNKSLSIKTNENIDLGNVSLINENLYQQKIIVDDKAIFKIIEIDTNKVLKEIIIEKN